MSSDLPDRPSLEHLKNQARERLRQLRLRVPGTRLADAQHAIARDYGFASWPRLKAHVDASTAAGNGSGLQTASHSPASNRERTNRMADRAVAVYLLESDSGELLGVALLVPSERYAATLINGPGEARHPALTPAAWREIDRWVIDGDTGLPAQPPPLRPAIAAALLERERSTVSARRFACFPMKRRGRAALTSSVQRLLPRLREAWLPAASVITR